MDASRQKIIDSMLAVGDAEPFARHAKTFEAIARKEGLFGELEKLAHQWETAGERFRELKIFGDFDLSSLASTFEQPKFKLDEATLKALGSLTSTLDSRFRSPEFQELQNLPTLISKALGPYTSTLQSRFDEIHEAFKGLKSPWVDAMHSDRSFKTLMQLTGLGEAVNSAPYTSLTTRTVNEALGLWNSYPPSLQDNPVLRDQFYVEHGFNSDLVAIPEPTFTEVLNATSVISIDSLLPDIEQFQFEIEKKVLSEDEERLISRMSRGATIIHRLEIGIRNFLHSIMIDRFGPGWEKNRIHGNGEIYKSWEVKKARAVEKGEKAFELIYYADFTDYEPIITRRDNWKDIFESIFSEQRDVTVSFKRLEPIRVLVMHSRPLTKMDFLTLGAEATRIFTAIGMLNKN